MTLDPFPCRWADLDGLACCYVDAGAGPPVVLVHGNPTWSFLYRSLLTALPAAGYRAIAPDHIWMGRSAKPPTSAYPYTLARRVADLGRLLDSLALEQPVTLVLHDWGGAIGMAWAVEHPDRVARVVLLNTAAFPLPPGKRLPLVLRVARSRPLGELAVRYANAFAVGATVVGVRRQRMPAEVRRGYVSPYDSPAHRVGIYQFLRDIPVRPGTPAYRVLLRTAERLDVLRNRPVLICWGMRDFVFDADILARWEEIYPQAEVHRFADAGHYVLEDVPEIVPLVLDFLARSESPAATG